MLVKIVSKNYPRITVWLADNPMLYVTIIVGTKQSTRNAESLPFFMPFFGIHPKTLTIEIFILKLGYGKHTEVINLQSIPAFTSDALSENKRS